MRNASTLLLCFALTTSLAANADRPPVTNKITYRLPYDGTERTWRVTLAATPKGEPNWIVSTILSGAVRTVNERNQGIFTEEWDGLDDNLMPVPPGEYAFKGICMPAEKWHIDGQQHTFIARYVASPGDSWTPAQENDGRFPPIHGQVFEPIRDISIAEDGKAVFLSGYIENWYNPFIVDLKRDVGIDQVIAKIPSAGREGGHLVAFDGSYIWMIRGGEVHRLNAASPAESGYSIHVLSRTRGQIASDLACAKVGERTILYICEPYARRISVLDGQGAKLRSIENVHAQACIVDRRDGKQLYTLAKKASGWAIHTLALKDGLPDGEWRTLFEFDASVSAPGDLEMDRNGFFYVINGRQVRKYAADGRLAMTIGKNFILHGNYDHEVLIRPQRLACWLNGDGKERIVITELGGPMRISEWSCAEGKLLREWLLCQNAAAGFCTDPEQPEHVYATALVSPELVRYRVNYETGEWKVDGVWEGMCHVDGATSFPGGRMFPRIIHRNGHKYLAFGGGSYRSRGQWMIYRYVDNRWLPSAGAINNHWWHDANGDGRLQSDEVAKKPFSPSPTGGDGPGMRGTGYAGSHWGDAFADDLSILASEHGAANLRRLRPRQFDKHGNPIFDGAAWEMIAVDPFMTGLREGQKLPLLRGGNEIGTSFWHWSDVAGAPETGYFVASVSPPDNPGGIDEAGYVGSQWKLTCWEPYSLAPKGRGAKGEGEYRMKWRIGRKALRLAESGEVYASLHVTPPVHGILGVHDGNGLYHLFTTDGLYVDTLMHHSLRFGTLRGGMYTHGGGCYFGKHFVNKVNGKVYVLMGRASNNIYEVPNWKAGVIQPLAIDAAAIALPAGLIAPPNAIALKLRQDLQARRPELNVVPDAVEFRIAREEPALNGSLTGWSDAAPIEFEHPPTPFPSPPRGEGEGVRGKVQVRCLFDMDHLYLHWHLRKTTRLAIADSVEPAKLLQGDVLSLYFQGDPLARPAVDEPRPGDAHIAFAIVNDNGKLHAAAVGMFPYWNKDGPKPANIAGRRFAHVAVIDGAELAFRPDADARGFMLAAKIPHAALGTVITPNTRTSADFAATVNGRTFRWRGPQDDVVRLHPASWAPVRFRFGASQTRSPLHLTVPQPRPFKAGEPMKLTGIQAPEGREIAHGVVHFRPRGEQEFLMLKLRRGFLGFEVDIPGQFTHGTIEYFIEVRLAADEPATYPANGGEAPASAVPDSGPPQTGAVFEAVQTKSYTVSLRWDKASDDIGIAGYRLYRAASRDEALAAKTPHAVLAPDRLTFDDVKPPQDTRLWYRLTPVDAVGRVGEPRIVSAAVPSDEPPRNGLRLYASHGPKGVLLSWHGDIEADVKRMTVFRADGVAGELRAVAVIDAPQPLGRWLDDAALPTQEHHYAVTLTDAAGKVSKEDVAAASKPGRYVRRLNCGGGEVMDLDGIAWEADSLAISGMNRWLTAEKIRHAPPALLPVFQSERWADGGLRYRFPVPAGRYEVVLLFAETNTAFAAPGKRTFDVIINGQKLHDNVDVVRDAGASTAWQLVSTIAVTEAGNIIVELVSRNAGPALKGIEVRALE